MKNYQTDELAAAIPVPKSVNVAMADIAATMRERACWPWRSVQAWLLWAP